MPFPWSIFLLVFIFLIFAFGFFVLWKRSRRKRLSGEQLQYIQSHWIRIIDAFKSHPNQSVMDADKLLDYALKCYGYEGPLGEKLKKAKGHFSDLNGVWSAHKLRNTLAHELVHVSDDVSRKALSQFKRALNDLGANL